MSSADRADRQHRGGLHRFPRWVWFNGAALAWGVLPVVLAGTVPDRGSVADPYCVRHCYTLLHEAGPAILGYVGSPAVISLVLFALLHRKGTRGSQFADRAAWSLAILSCLISLVGLTSAAGVEMLPVAALNICAVLTAPSGPSPTRVKRSPRNPLPDAARNGSGSQGDAARRSQGRSRAVRRWFR